MFLGKLPKISYLSPMFGGVKTLLQKSFDEEETTLVLKREGVSNNTSLSTSYRSPITSIVRNTAKYLFQQPICEKPKIPHMVIEPSYHEYIKGLEFHYRLPDQGPYLTHSFDLSLLNLARLDSLSQKVLGITDFQSTMFFGYSEYEVLKNFDTRQIIDVISHYNGYFFRIFVMSIFGLGCAVWYSFIPGLVHQLPIENPMFTMKPYDLIQTPYFQSFSLGTPNEVSALVLSAFEHQYPFTEITMNASGIEQNVLSLGLMVSLFITTGKLPPGL